MKISRIAALLPLLLAGAVSAAQDPFYTITEVATSSARGDAKFGPWALSISGDGSTVSALAVKSNWYSYFRMAPSGMDLAHRFRYETACTDIPLSSAACDAYLDNSNYAAQWFADLSSSNADQTYNVIASGVDSDAISANVVAESEGIVTRYGRDDSEVTSVGYVSLSEHKRKAVATIADTSVDVTTGTDYAFASAYDIIPVGTDYLVLGSAGNKKSTAYTNCYSNSSIESNSKYCPGYETQAAFWLVNSAGVKTKQLATSYDTSETIDYPYTASAMKVAYVDGKYVAVGYSATEGDNSKPKNLATFWNLGTLSDGALPAALGSKAIFVSSSDNPGTDEDIDIDNSWAVDINSDGYIVGNRVYRKLVSRNYPTQMFVAKYDAGSQAITSTSIPVSTDGVNSEAAALNNSNQVVGWTDERSVTTQPVYRSVPRLQEAFLYNIKTGSRYAINDLICSSTTSCAQGGKYYYIEYANDILDDGTVLASARRFDNYDDWSTLSNGTNVVVKLAVSTSTAFDDNGNVPSSYVVDNQLPVFDYGASDSSSGGGSFGFFGLFAMAGAALLGQYRRFVKKGS